MSSFSRKIVVIILSAGLASCAVLTKSQIEAVGNLSAASSGVETGPSVVFSSLSDVREGRGAFFVASLSSAEARVTELEALYGERIEDEKVAKKAEACTDVLNSYLRSLRSLSSEDRWKSAGTEIRGLGRNIDSMVIKYNKLGWSEEMQEGRVKTLSYAVAYIAQEYLKLRQAKALREYVTIGDTLVGLCVDQMVEILKDEKVRILIKQESVSAKEDYMAYVHYMGVRGSVIPMEADERYIEILGGLDKTEKIRRSTISSLQALKRGHHKLMLDIKSTQKIDVVFAELVELSNESARLSKLFKDEQ